MVGITVVILAVTFVAEKDINLSGGRVLQAWTCATQHSYLGANEGWCCRCVVCVCVRVYGSLIVVDSPPSSLLHVLHQFINMAHTSRLLT